MQLVLKKLTNAFLARFTQQKFGSNSKKECTKTNQAPQQQQEALSTVVDVLWGGDKGIVNWLYHSGADCCSNDAPSLS